VAALIDIIVPAYRGDSETRACLASVRASKGTRPFELVVVDDASPEPALSAGLRDLANAGRITLLAHAQNRGFVASVNEAMALHPDRDVILLNSDTEVAGDWVDRLTAHAARDVNVVTVTPFSGNATICSYPRTLEPNALPEGETTRSLDAAFAAANAGRAVPIPTAVGFCMYIARRALECVGPFDEARYGRGYGEEVDFCMRAARAGFRHLLAGDVYVRHIGEVSFGGAGNERRVQAQATVDALYPEFQERLRAFLASDPPRGLRRRADLERLRVSQRPRELFVVDAADRRSLDAATAVARSAAAHAEPLLLEASDAGWVLRWPRAGEELALFLPPGKPPRRFVALLRAIGIARVVLAESHRLAPLAGALARQLSCPGIGLGARASAPAMGAAPAPPGSGPAWPELPAEWLRPGAPARPSGLRRLFARLRRGG
jgi:GT2 family glycosyltransferase